MSKRRPERDTREPPRTDAKRGLTRRGVLVGTAAVGSAAALGLLGAKPIRARPRKPIWIGHM